MLNFTELTLPDKYLKLIINESIIFDALLDKYPEIKEDLYSSREHIDCACRRRVVNFLNEKIKNQEDAVFFENLINNPDPKVKAYKKEIDVEYEFDKKSFEERTRRKTNAKKIYKINKDEESWNEFSKFVEENIEFKSFFILEKTDHLEIRFL
jgi:hypothetical protein